MTDMGQEEKEAVLRVLDSGYLSGYLAGELHGGPEVEALEAEWAEHFGARHAIAMNSATSGLIAACGAVGVCLFDEVIVSPLTMSATATAPMVHGGKSVFVDIEPDFFCMDPGVMMREITSRDIDRLRAVIVTDLFGQPHSPKIEAFAHDVDIPVIVDASQNPQPFSGGDITVYSLNYHKHIHCGEGGMVTTQSDEYAERLRLIRNHAECAGKPYFGFNFRLTEIQAAIARVQLKKLDGIIQDRQERAQNLVGLAPTRPGYTHAYYLYPFLGEAPKEASPYLSYLPDLPLFAYARGTCPVAEEVARKLRVVRP